MSNISYRFNKVKNSSFDIRLLYVSKAKYEEDWHSTMHLHPFTELFYVVDGSGLFRINEENFTVQTDDLVIVNANQLHTESSKDANPLEYIVLGIDGVSLGPFEGSTQLLTEDLYSVQNHKRHRNEILFFLENILKEAEMQQEHYEIICHNLLEVLLLNLTRITKSDIILSADSVANKDCAYIKKYIDVHYSLDLDLDTLAAATYMNKYYLSHSFKRAYGISPINYLIEKRISVAKFLLETTKHSVSQIAVIVGYNSPSYFSQIFKRRTGVTPREYRLSNQIVKE